MIGRILTAVAIILATASLAAVIQQVKDLTADIRVQSETICRVAGKQLKDSKRIEELENRVSGLSEHVTDGNRELAKVKRVAYRLSTQMEASDGTADI